MQKPRIAIVGLGFGRQIAENQLATGPGAQYFELAALCDANPARLDPLAAKLNVPGVRDLDTLLADKSIDTIALYSGPVGRADLIRRMIRAGKHVITTKPFERDAEAAIAVLNEASALGRVVHLNSPCPLPSPDLVQIMRWREEFKLGRPIAARGEMWSSYREKPDGSWYDDPDQCPVAPVLRLGIYLINDLLRLVGKPESVQVMHSRLFTGRPTPDNAQLSIRFADGTLANVFASFCINDKHWWMGSLTLNFENGTIYRNVGPTQGTDPRKRPEMSLVTVQDGRQITRTAVPEGSSEDYQWDYFHRAIRGDRRDDEITPEQIADGLRVIAAMRRAEAQGGTQKV